MLNICQQRASEKTENFSEKKRPAVFRLTYKFSELLP